MPRDLIVLHVCIELIDGHYPPTSLISWLDIETLLEACVHRLFLFAKFLSQGFIIHMIQRCIEYVVFSFCVQTVGCTTTYNKIPDYLFQSCSSCRHNPLARLRWQKNKMTHPVGYQKAKTRARFNYINPLFYVRRIKNNLSSVGRRRRAM